MANFKELLVFGPARFFDEVRAKAFIGDIQGTATAAHKDDLNQNIASTYVKNIIDNEGASETITFVLGDGTTKTFTTKNTQVDVVDNLTSTSTTSALSANQGKVLKDAVDAVDTAITWTSFDPASP